MGYRKDQKRMRRTNHRHNGVLLNKFVQDFGGSTPHPLLCIDEATFQIFQDNTIVLCNMRRTPIVDSPSSDGGITSYEVSKIGEHLLPLFSTLDDNNHCDISNIRHDYMFFMCSTSEKCLIDDPNVVYIGDREKSRDYAILLLLLSDVTKFQKDAELPRWDNVEDLKMLQKIKRSTVKNNQASHHYGSTGLCYSFGVRNAYSMDETGKVSLTRYVGDMKETASYFKHFIHYNFHTTFKAFDVLYPGFSYKLNLCVEAMQHVSKNTMLKSFITSDEDLAMSINPFLLTSNINIDCKTKDLHCERDVSYTTIMVPYQNVGNFIIFEFKLNEQISFSLKCPASSCFTYSAYCLYHRQFQTSGGSCINLSSYCNKSFFCNFRKSLERLRSSS